MCCNPAVSDPSARPQIEILIKNGSSRKIGRIIQPRRRASSRQLSLASKSPKTREEPFSICSGRLLPAHRDRFTEEDCAAVNAMLRSRRPYNLNAFGIRLSNDFTEGCSSAIKTSSVLSSTSETLLSLKPAYSQSLPWHLTSSRILTLRLPIDSKRSPHALYQNMRT